MKFWIIDEVGLKENNTVIRGLNIQQIEIPDEILEKFKTAYELWFEKQNKKQGEENEEAN